MSEAIAKPTKAPRRSQEDRRTDTRRKLIDATIRCLYRVGYSAVTISMVAADASVSRGIISYHFANKADLMVAVRDAVYLDERQALEEVRESIGTVAYLQQLSRLTSVGMRREAAIAVNEILLAARADPELIEKLRKTEREIEQRAMDRLLVLFQEVGVKPPANLIQLMRVSVATFRGLAMAELVQGPEAETDVSVDFLAHLIEQTYPIGLTPRT